MGFGPVGSIRKQVMKQMRDKDKMLNDLMKSVGTGYYTPTKTKSKSEFNITKNKVY